MKLLSRLTASIAALTIVGCGSKSSTSEVPATTASTSLIISQVPTTLATTTGTQTITPTGGTPPYTFSLSDPSAGTLSTTSGTATVFTGSGSGASTTVIVTDAKGVMSYIPVIFTTGTTTGGGTTTVGTCAGNYNISVNGSIGTMSILMDSTGRLAGNITLNGGVAAIAGTCSSTGTITFLNQYSGSQYSGSFGVQGTQMMMTGSFLTITGGTYPWSAVAQ